MSKRIRYLLIALGLGVFLVASPLILLFVSGLEYDFAEKKFVATAILALESEPQDVQIFLDGRLAKNRSGEIRFLKPRTYEVTLKKNGYYDWTKTVTMEPNRVTWVSPPEGKIYLLKNTPTFETLSAPTLDFAVWSDGLAVLAPKSLRLSDSWDLSSSKDIPLPEGIATLNPSGDFKMFLLTGLATSSPGFQGLVLDGQTEQLFDLKELFPKTDTLPEFAFSRNGNLLALSQGTLYEINPKTSSKKALISEVLAFTVEEETIYHLSGTTAARLETLNLDTKEKQTLISGLPATTGTRLIVNAQKRIFLAANKTLYTVSEGDLSAIAENLQNLAFNRQDNTLSFQASGELKYLNFDGKLNQVTRISSNLQQPQIASGIGYALYLRDNRLEALELDLRGQQNSYLLYQGQDITKYWLGKDKSTIFILDNGSLNTIIIR